MIYGGVFEEKNIDYSISLTCLLKGLMQIRENDIQLLFFFSKKRTFFGHLYPKITVDQSLNCN